MQIQSQDGEFSWGSAPRPPSNSMLHMLSVLELGQYSVKTPLHILKIC